MHARSNLRPEGKEDLGTAAATEPLDQSTSPTAAHRCWSEAACWGPVGLTLGHGIWPGIVLALAIALPDCWFGGAQGAVVSYELGRLGPSAERRASGKEG
jgi:hypothetical protein